MQLLIPRIQFVMKVNNFYVTHIRHNFLHLMSYLNWKILHIFLSEIGWELFQAGPVISTWHVQDDTINNFHNFAEMGRGYKKKTARATFKPEDMNNAVFLFLEKGYSFRMVASQFENIDYKTLSRYIYWIAFINNSNVHELW